MATRRRNAAQSRRDLTPTCVVRLYVGSNIPGKPGKYRGLPASFDSRVFRDRVERLVGRSFAGATYLKTRGIWKGEGEDGVMIEIVASPVRSSCRRLFKRTTDLARRIARALGQQAVLVVAEDANGRTFQDVVLAA